jgi:hypothetical protein
MLGAAGRLAARLRSVILRDAELAAVDTFAGDVVVQGAGTLRLLGTIDGDLHVDAGGFVVLYGRVTGDVVNDGGRLLVYGVVDGLVHRFRGFTYVDPSACVGASPPRRPAAATELSAPPSIAMFEARARPVRLRILSGASMSSSRPR